MSKKIVISFVVLASLGVILSALAQAQNPATPSSAMDNQGVINYLLGPGDVLDVRVFGQTDLNSLAEIDSEGNISSLPFLETPIRAQCRTEKEVQISIAEAYSKYLKNPQVSARIAERKSRPPATVIGAVCNPMLVTMLRSVLLHELLARAGGITGRASGTIQIIHTQSEMCPEPMEQIQRVSATSAVAGQIETFKLSELRGGNDNGDPYIRPGDVVNFMEGEPIYVFGAVGAPREIYMKDQLTLGRAIAMAGGPQRLANTKEVHVYRVKDGVIGQEDLKFNYDGIRKGREKDVLLQPNDIIEVRMTGFMTPKNLAEILQNLGRQSIGIPIQRGLIY